MATKSYYLTATTSGSWRTIDETPVTAATNADGWVVSTGATNHSEYAVGVERASTTFTGTAVPDGSLDTSLKDAFRSTNALNGTFASGNWTFNFVVRGVTSASTQNGRIRFRIIKAASDGSSATEITSGQQQASLTGAIANTTNDFTSSLTVNPGAFTLNNEYLFIQVAWERTAAGPMTTSDVNWRTGSSSSAGTRIVTSDFLPAQAVTGGTISATMDQDIAGAVGSTGAQPRGQSIIGDGRYLSGASFWHLRSSSGTTGTSFAELYAASGSHGSTAVPTGSALATSAGVDVSTFPVSGGPSPAEAQYTFDGTFKLVAGTTYIIVAAQPSGVFAEIDSGLTHAGNQSVLSGSWSTVGTSDLRFQVRVTNGLFSPTVAIAAGGDQAVTGGTVSSSLAVQQPSVAYVVALPTRTSTALINSPGSTAVSSPNNVTVVAFTGSEYSQSFTQVAGPLLSCVFPLKHSGTNPASLLQVELRQDSWDGTVLATSDSYNESGLTTSFQNITFLFSSPVTLVRATTYHLRFLRTPTDAVKTVNPGGNLNSYSNGALYVSGSIQVNSDLAFSLNVYAGVAYEINGSAIASTAALTQPDVTPGAVALTGHTVTSTLALSPPSTTYVVSSPTIASTEVLSPPTTAYVISGPTANFIDGYAFGNCGSSFGLDLNGVHPSGVSQSFLGDGRIVAACRFLLNKTGAAFGVYAAKIYEVTGTHGSSALPTGSALAETPSRDIDVLTNSPQEITLSFLYPVVLTNGVTYALTIEVSSASVDNALVVGIDATSSAHAGNPGQQDILGSWSVLTNDLGFEVHSGSIANAPSSVEVVTFFSVTTDFISSTVALTSPTIDVGPAAITGHTVASTLTFSPPTITTGDVSVTTITINSTETFFAPSLTRDFIIVGAGTLITSGVANVARGQTVSGAGAVILGGSVVPIRSRLISASGTITLSGSVTPLRGASLTPQGEIVLGGSAGIVIIGPQSFSITGAGQLTCGGAAVFCWESGLFPAGGMQLAGAGNFKFGKSFTGTGTLVTGGTVVPQFGSEYSVVGAGGAVLSGTAGIIRGGSIRPSGKITTSGSVAPLLGRSFSPVGGAVLSGAATITTSGGGIVTFEIIGSGTIICGGSAILTASHSPMVLSFQDENLVTSVLGGLGVAHFGTTRVSSTVGTPAVGTGVGVLTTSRVQETLSTE